MSGEVETTRSSKGAILDRRNIISAGLASTLGWAMDLYDLMILLYVATFIGPLIFPSDSPTLQLAFVYASFAVTLLMRPLGSAIFGSLADRSGRKRAMLIAIVGVGIATALMGAVPTYATVGMLAPIIFVLLRLAQGVFVGGVVASTHTLGTETVPAKHRGLMSGIIGGAGAGLGALAASLVFLLLSSVLSPEQFASYGWRIMFFTALLTTGLSFIVYSKTNESPLFEAAKQGAPKKKSPIAVLFSKEHRGRLLVNVVLAAGGASVYYLTVGFFPTFLKANVGMEGKLSAYVMIIVNLVVIVASIFGGALSDKVGRRPVFLYLGIPLLIIGPVFYLWLGKLGPGQFGLAILLTCIMSFIALAWQAPLLIFLNERFPTSIRATGTSLSWNMGFAIGGMMPTIVTALSPEISDFPSRLAATVGIMVLLGVIAAFFAGETKHLGLRASADEADKALEPVANSAA